MNALPDFLRPLEFLTQPFPQAAVEQVIARREESIPHLIGAIEWITEAAADLPEPDYMLHLYALFLLAQFREARAYHPIIKLARHPLVDDILGDTIAENLGRIIASVCDGDEAPIRALIEDAGVDEFVRGAGLRALAVRALAGFSTCEAASAYFVELFDGRLERKPNHVWDELVSVCLDLRMTEHLPAIRRAYASGLTDPFVQRLTEVELEIHSPPLAPGRWPWEHCQPINDTIKAMSGWCCFDPESRREETEDEIGDELLDGGETNGAFEQWREAKVGRNEPCPCGSGRKYKKCCGAAGNN